MGDLSFTARIQLMHRRHAIATVSRNTLEDDIFQWPHAFGEVVRLKCKIFAWLAAQYCCGPPIDGHDMDFRTHPRRATHVCRKKTLWITFLLNASMLERCVMVALTLQVDVVIPEVTGSFIDWSVRTRDRFGQPDKRGTSQNAHKASATNTRGDQSLETSRCGSGGAA